METVIAIIGVGVTLLLAILGVWRDIKNELHELHIDITDLRSDVSKLSERVARIEGRLDERDRHTT